MTEPTSRSSVRILERRPHDAPLLQALVPSTLHAARRHSATWLATSCRARFELARAADGEGIACAAVDGDGEPPGRIPAAGCDACAWEIHPLLVDPARHGRGIGRRVLNRVEERARRSGACTVTLSTSDSIGAATLHGLDLFPDPLAALPTLDTVAGHEDHALGFWRRMGYTVTGVLPDAEGFANHGVLLSGRLRGPPVRTVPDEA